MLDFLSKNEALYEYQFGFRPAHSTQHAIITLVDRITKSLDSLSVRTVAFPVQVAYWI